MFFCIHDLNLYGIYKYILYSYSQNLKYKILMYSFINILFCMIEVIISYLIRYNYDHSQYRIILSCPIILSSYHLIILSILYILGGLRRNIEIYHI